MTNQPMKRFYFTYGTAEQHPFYGGWTVVTAADKHRAVTAFRAVHPDVNENLINCASIYSEEDFFKTDMASEGNIGHYAHEYIVENIEFDHGLLPNAKKQAGVTREHTRCAFSELPIYQGTEVYAVLLAQQHGEPDTPWTPISGLLTAMYDPAADTILTRFDDQTDIPIDSTFDFNKKLWKERIENGGQFYHWLEECTSVCDNMDILDAAYHKMLMFQTQPDKDGDIEMFRCAVAVFDKDIIDKILDHPEVKKIAVASDVAKIGLVLSKLYKHWMPSTPVKTTSPTGLLMDIYRIVSLKANAALMAGTNVWQQTDDKPDGK